MLTNIKAVFGCVTSRREAERRALADELDTIAETRRNLDRREQEIVARAGRLAAVELNALPARLARGY